MDLSEFYELVDEVFTRAYGRSLLQDQRLVSLCNRTAAEALHEGVDPRIVWNLLCEHMDIEPCLRWGNDHKAPPLPYAYAQSLG